MAENRKPKVPGPRWSFEARVFFLALLIGLPGIIATLILLWQGNYDGKTIWTISLLLGGFWLACAYALREKVRFPLQTLSNLLAAIREGDYSIRARGARRDDALGEIVIELNMLGENLREQRLGAIEASALLSKVMAEIEVAVFTLDAAQKLRLVNRAGERLLGRPAERLLDRTASELGLADCLQGDPARTIQVTFPGGTGRWGMRRSTFRERGAPHHLLVLTDLSRTLREEERQAWQRLLRVLGHELNNSLAPIKSIAASMETLLSREPTPPDWKDDMRQGLSVISTRTEALNRFMDAYTRVARLPQPRLGKVDVSAWVQRVANLETRLKIQVQPGPSMIIRADGDQLDQLLINLLRNAADAALETRGDVRIGWNKNGAHVEVWIEDEGPGLSNTSNLFVPFFTTKPKGSGIGLVLSRQIAEAHGGSVALENRPNAVGCLARLRLPIEIS
jgi:two-component system, NtrC family, nitrogen regulation sensor histidine kinase NtrY